MRIFLICLSLIYVLGVSYTQRFSLGGSSCDLAAGAFSFNSGQTDAQTQHAKQMAFSAGKIQQQFGPAKDVTGAGKNNELGHVGVTRANIDPC